MTNRELALVLFFALPVTSGARLVAQTVIIPPGGGASTAIRPDSIQDGSMYGYFTHTDAQGVAGGALLGKVQISGDPLMWDPVPVNVNCAGKIVFSAYSDAKGQFLIKAVNANGALSLQGDAKRQMETHFEGCTVTATLAGFDSSSITITHRNFRDAPDIGVLNLTRKADAKGTAVGSARESVSPKAIKLYEKARSDWEKQSVDHVRDDLQEAVAIDPNFAEAWYQLGRLEAASSPGQAREDFGKALAANPRFLLPFEELLVLDSAEGKWKDSLTDGGRALALYPHGTPKIWYVYAEGILKAYAAGALPKTKLKTGETSAVNSLSLDPQHSVPAEQLLALILAEEKNFAGAILHLQNCLDYLPKSAGTEQVRQQIAHLEELKKTTVQ